MDWIIVNVPNFDLKNLVDLICFSFEVHSKEITNNRNKHKKHKINTSLTTGKPKLDRQGEPPSTERKPERLKSLANRANESRGAV